MLETPTRTVASPISKATTSEDATSARQSPLWMIVTAFVLGAFLAWLRPRYQFGVVGSLTIAGVIPHTNAIMDQYYHSVWSLILQFGAVMLQLFPQFVLTWTFAMMTVGLRLAAYSMLIYGFGGGAVFSIVAGVFCYATNFLINYFLSGDAFAGWASWLDPIRDTYSNIAFAASCFVFGALASRRNSWAGFVTALMIAIHIDIGVFMSGLLLVLVLASGLRLIKLPTEGIIRGYLIGFAVVLVSFIAYVLMRPHVGTVDYATYDTYMRLWEAHRDRPYDPDADGYMAIIALPAAIALGFLWRGATAVKLTLAYLLLCIVSSSILYRMAHSAFVENASAANVLVRTFRAALPGRLVDVHASIVGALAIAGACWIIARRNWPKNIAAGAQWAVLLIFALAWPPRSMPYPTFGASAFTVAGQMISTARDRLGGVGGDALAPRDARDAGAYDDPFWQQVRAANVRQPVLTSPYAATWAQLYGHLAVVHDPLELDIVPYFPPSARQEAQIIEYGYGVPFNSPPESLQHMGSLRSDTGRSYWATLSPAQWQSLGEKLNFVGVLAHRDWPISLKPTIEQGAWALYLLTAQPK